MRHLDADRRAGGPGAPVCPLVSPLQPGDDVGGGSPISSPVRGPASSHRTELVQGNCNTELHSAVSYSFPNYANPVGDEVSRS